MLYQEVLNQEIDARNVKQNTQDISNKINFRRSLNASFFYVDLHKFNEISIRKAPFYKSIEGG